MKNFTKIIFLLLSLFISFSGISQAVTLTPNGAWVPSMTTTVRTSLIATAGQLVYDSDTKSFWYYNGTAWTGLSTSTGAIKYVGTSYLGQTSGSGSTGTSEGTSSDLYNIAIGSDALNSNTNGSSNIALGRNALRFTTSGGENTAIGINSGVGFTNTTTGNRNTFIGANAGPFGDGLTNATAIGYNAVVNSSNSLVLGSGVNVGIGTSSPSERLEVNGKIKTINFQMQQNAENGYILKSDVSGNGTWVNPTSLFTESDPKVGSLTNNYFPKWEDTKLVNGLLFDDGNNMGIGTASPNAKLEILTNNIKPLIISSSNTIATDLTFKNTSSNSSSVIRWTGLNNSLGSKKLFFMNPDNAIVMTIDHSLNRVGIGTDSPAELMDVNGKMKTADFQMTTGASNGRILKSDATGNASWASLSAIETDPKVASTTSDYLARWNGTSLIDGSIYDNGAQVGLSTSTISVDSKLAIGAVNGTEGGQIQLNSGSARTVAYFMDNYDDKLRIMSGSNSASVTHHFTMNNSGNIGLGTFSPTEKLDVRGKVKTETFQMTESAINGYVLTSDANGNAAWTAPQSSSSWTISNANTYSALAGNVGIGTSIPSTKFHVSGNSTLEGQVNFNDNWNIQSGSDFWLEKNGTRYMTIYGTGGYTGIGTNAPKSLLEVNGAIGLKISTQSGSTAVTLDNTATVWYFTGTASIILPTASTCTNRLYRIVNRQGSSRTISSFINTSGTATTSISTNSTVEIISDGTNWLQIN